MKDHLRERLDDARQRYDRHFQAATDTNRLGCLVYTETICDLEQARADILSILSALRWIEADK